MIINFGNIRDILKRCRGLFEIKYIWWESLFAKKENREGLFGKKGYKGWGSLVNRGKVGGFGAKALLLPLPHAEQRRGGVLGAGGRFRRPGARRRPGLGAKEGGGRGGSNPVLTLGQGRNQR